MKEYHTELIRYCLDHRCIFWIKNIILRVPVWNHHEISGQKTILLREIIQFENRRERLNSALITGCYFPLIVDLTKRDSRCQWSWKHLPDVISIRKIKDTADSQLPQRYYIDVFRLNDDGSRSFDTRSKKFGSDNWKRRANPLRRFLETFSSAGSFSRNLIASLCTDDMKKSTLVSIPTNSNQIDDSRDRHVISESEVEFSDFKNDMFIFTLQVIQRIQIKLEDPWSKYTYLDVNTDKHKGVRYDRARHRRKTKENLTMTSSRYLLIDFYRRTTSALFVALCHIFSVRSFVVWSRYIGLDWESLESWSKNYIMTCVRREEMQIITEDCVVMITSTTSGRKAASIIAHRNWSQS